MNEHQAVTVNLAAWRAWRKAVFDCDQDTFHEGRAFYEVQRDNRGNVLVAQGMMSHWLPLRFVKVVKP